MENNKIEKAKESISTLSGLVPYEQVSKASLEHLANQLMANVKSPIVLSANIKVISEFINILKGKLEEEVLNAADKIPESQRKIGNLKFAKVIRTTIKYDQDEKCKDLDTQLKAAKKVIKEEVDKSIKLLEETGEMKTPPVEYNRTEYIKWDIPKA